MWRSIELECVLCKRYEKRLRTRVSRRISWNVDKVENNNRRQRSIKKKSNYWNETNAILFHTTEPFIQKSLNYLNKTKMNSSKDVIRQHMNWICDIDFCDFVFLIFVIRSNLVEFNFQRTTISWRFFDYHFSYKIYTDSRSTQ